MESCLTFSISQVAKQEFEPSWPGTRAVLFPPCYPPFLIEDASFPEWWPTPSSPGESSVHQNDGAVSLCGSLCWANFRMSFLDLGKPQTAPKSHFGFKFKLCNPINEFPNESQTQLTFGLCPCLLQPASKEFWHEAALERAASSKRSLSAGKQPAGQHSWVGNTLERSGPFCSSWKGCTWRLCSYMEKKVM